MFYEDMTTPIKNCTKDIKKKKSSLIQRAGRKGMIWENFGQKEVRELEDKYWRYVYECKEIRLMLYNFGQWAMTFTLGDLK